MNSSLKRKQWLQIGIVGKPYGLRGAFYISGREEPLQMTFSEVSIGKVPSTGYTARILIQKVHNSRSLLTVEGLIDRTAIERYVGEKVWVLAEELVFDEASEYLWKDLIGKNVLDVNGKIIGEVCSVNNHGASDIVGIANEKGETLELPFVPTYFVMDFLAADKNLYLLVEKDTFDGLWQLEG
ncbi:MAG: ribosome maturation factor RimM [Bdellovibrionota bacterium]